MQVTACSAKTIRVVGAVLLATACYSTAHAGDRDRSGIDPRFTEANKAEWQARRDRIEQELAQLQDHPWAGGYYHGDGLGANLTVIITPEAGFAFQLRGCLGVYDRNYGAVTVRDDGTLVLECELPNQRPRAFGLPSELIPVPWGQRRYLIAPDHFRSFCNAINSGREPRDERQGSFFLRSEDHEIQVEGLPVMPEESYQYLRGQPVCAETIEIGESHTTGLPSAEFEWLTTSVTLNAGTADGVFEGMEFYVHQPSDAGAVGSIEVTSVSEQESVGTIRQFQSEDWRPTPPAVGWRLCTMPPWRHPSTSRAPLPFPAEKLGPR